MNSSAKLSHPIDLSNLENEIRPMPTTAAKIMSLCNSAETHVAEITRLIECEPAVAVKLLAMANSPLYGASREITSVNHAIVLLGYKTVSQLALTIAAGPLFTSGDEAVMEHRQALFQESLAVATVSKLLADKLGLADSSEAFLGGMMLDVGKLYFFDVVPEAYLQIIAQSGGIENTMIENEVFGTDHPTIGSHFGKKWGLPNRIIELIRNHHCRIEDVDDALVKTVLSGIYFARKWNVGFEACPSFESCETLENEIAATDACELAESAATLFESVKTVFSV